MAGSQPVPLPAPPSEPLHLLPALLPWVVVALGILVLVALWLLLRGQDARVEPTRSGRIAMPAPDLSSIEVRIASLLDRYTRAEDYRAGCHALAALARVHLEQATRLDVEEMTSDEIARTLADGSISALMTDLRTLQYRRREPKRSHLTAICARAGESLAGFAERWRSRSSSPGRRRAA